MYTIYLTTQCNFCCSYCYENYNNSLELTPDNLLKTINFIFHYDTSKKIKIDFMGGEPLLKKELICQAVSYITENYPEREVKYYITTNGSLLDISFIEFMKQNSFNIRLSFDGCKEAHDLNRIAKDGKSHYQKIFHNILTVREQKISFSIRITINKKTIPYMYKNIVFLHENGLDNICLIPDVYLKFTGETLQEFKKQINFITDYYIQELDGGRKLIIDQFDGKFFHMLCDFGNCFSMCDAGVESFKIMPDGSVYPCGFLTNNIDYKIGDIHTNTIHVNKAKKLACSLFDKKDTKCKECNIKDFCHGMKCGYMNFINTGKINRPSEATCHCEHIFYPAVKRILEHMGTLGSSTPKLTLRQHYEYIDTADLRLSLLGRMIKNNLQNMEAV